MRHQRLFLVLGVMFLGILRAFSESNRDTATQNTLLKAIQEKIDRQDPDVWLEVSKLPAYIAVPIFEKYFLPYNTGDMDNRAIAEAIKELENYSVYFDERIARAATEGHVDTNAFLMLSLIGSQQAQKVVAPYLFDFRAHRAYEDVADSIIAFSALDSLARMNIQDAPLKKDRLSYLPLDILPWQAWSKRKQFVSTSMPIGIPDEFVKDAKQIRDQ